MKKIVLTILGIFILAYVVGLFITKEINTQITIKSTPSYVWIHLTNFQEYPDWNPFIKEIAGEAIEGTQLDVVINPPDGDPMSFTPELLVVKEDEELRWIGQLLLPGLFDGEHYFKIQRISEEEVLFLHGEEFTGILALLFWGSVEPGTKKGFQLMNEALKKRVEEKSNQI